MIDDGDTLSASYLMREHAPMSFQLLKEYTLREDSPIYREFYHQSLIENYPHLIHSYLVGHYVSMEHVFLHASAYLYEQEMMDLSDLFDQFARRQMAVLYKQGIDNMPPKDIIETLHRTIVSHFILESESPSASNIAESLVHQSISQYTLAILYLIIAERMELPIFGLPYEDKLVLVYTQPYCLHSESVLEEDILYYILLGEKDLIYTPFDLELLAILRDEPLTIHNKLPQSNSHIIDRWIRFVIADTKNVRLQNRLSIKYQQICNLKAEVESF